MMPQQIETTSVNYSSPVSLKKKLKMWKKCELELNKTDLCTTAKGVCTLYSFSVSIRTCSLTCCALVVVCWLFVVGLLCALHSRNRRCS